MITAAAVVITAWMAADSLRPPGERLAARAMVAAIHAYRATLSAPLAAQGFRCRFEPSCSVYAEACIEELGALGGGVAAARRILRCGPWTERGTEDPPPQPASAH